jgi:hypothetical protein
MPPGVQDKLSGDHLSFFFRRAVERLDLRGFERGYAVEGSAMYAACIYVDALQPLPVNSRKISASRSR